MTIKIIKGDSKRVFHHPATGLSFCYPDRYLIYNVLNDRIWLDVEP